jgi:hypothetical protein
MPNLLLRIALAMFECGAGMIGGAATVALFLCASELSWNRNQQAFARLVLPNLPSVLHANSKKNVK